MKAGPAQLSDAGRPYPHHHIVKPTTTLSNPTHPTPSSALPLLLIFANTLINAKVSTCSLACLQAVRAVPEAARPPRPLQPQLGGNLGGERGRGRPREDGVSVACSASRQTTTWSCASVLPATQSGGTFRSRRKCA